MYVLRNVARVSKRFKKLSEDPFLIRKIELHPVGHSMYAKGQFRYCLKVLKTSKKVIFFSFDLEWKFAWSNSQAYKNFLRILSNINHGYLKYFCIKVEHRLNDTSDSKASLMGKLMRYLEKCPNLKILKIEFTETKHYPDEDYMFDGGVTFRDLAWLDEKAILEFRFQNLEELHLNGFDLGPLLPDQAFRSRFAALTPNELGNILNKCRANFPKLRRLCLKLDNIANIDPSWSPEAVECDQILQKFASERNVEIEITGTPEFRRLVVEGEPSSVFKIYTNCN